MSSYKSALAVAAIALVNHGVYAWYKDLPMCVDTYQPFAPMGCYDNAGPGALLQRMDMDSNNMTIEACTATCKGNAFEYAALAYVGTCYCGNTVNTQKVDSSLCYRQCSGNSSEICGGDASVAIYHDTTFPDISAKTTDAYTPLGCYTDYADARPVFFRQDNLSASNLTTKACLKSCLLGGFPYAATEYGGECYCGVVLGNGTTTVSSSQCSMPCNGNAEEMCGGPSHQSVYLARELQCNEPCGYAPPGPPATYSVSSIPATYKPSPSTSTLAESSPVSVQSPTGYGIIGTVTSTVAESSPVSTPASYGATTPATSTLIEVVSTSTSTVAASSPVSVPASYGVNSPSPSTPSEVISTSPTLQASSSTPVVTPSTSPSTPIESTSATQAASSPATSSYVVNIPSLSTPVVNIPSTLPTSSLTPTSGISSTQAVSTTTSTTPITTPATMPITTLPSTLKTSTTVTAPGVCTAVQVAPPKCDFGCGKWCYTLPEWKNSKECSDSWSHCMINIASCYMNAGFPDALNCIGFAQWCGKVKDFCGATPQGNKDSCTKAWPPVKPTVKLELTTTTMTVPCVATTKVAAVSSAITTTKPAIATTTLKTPAPTTTATTTCAIATPTGICQQPKNTASGYDVHKPLGGIKLPSLTCNNVEAEHRAGNIFKLYTEQDTKKCASFKAPQVADACSQACRSQYDQCVSVYAEGCRTKGKYNGKAFGLGYSPKGAFVSRQPRGYPLLGARTEAAVAFTDSYDGAKTKCVQQWRDCLSVNKDAVTDKCKKYGFFS